MAKPVCRSYGFGDQTGLTVQPVGTSRTACHGPIAERVNRWASLLRAARVNRSKRGGDHLPGPVGRFGALQNQGLIAGRVLHFQAPGVQGDAARVERHG